MEFDELSKKVIGCVLEVQKTLGPGLLESVYEKCLSYELKKAGLKHQIQKESPVHYKEIQIAIPDSLIPQVDSVVIISQNSFPYIYPMPDSWSNSLVYP